ncbi:MAG TPA: NADH-quinone oxidoreductase subunit C [Ktedonobacterales bacterium]|jgi:NADH-quinone oxidoreductase subunit C
MAETTKDLAVKTVEAVRSKFGEVALEVVEHRGETTILLPPEKVPAVAKFLRDHPALRYNYMADLTAVDWPEREPRFDVVYHLLSLDTRAVIRLKTRVGQPGEDHPAVPTISHIWPTANWYEREVYDLFGITFSGHPDLRRILMPDDWTSYPLRKEYPLTGIELPEPHWGGQIPFNQPLPQGIGRQTMRINESRPPTPPRPEPEPGE